jgi:nucleotide-binding universal stress UspA family protein
MNTILVAYDDTDSGKVALQRAAEMTARLHANLVVATVAPVLYMGRYPIERVDPVDSPARRQELLADARAYLTEQGVDARYVCQVGHPADEIVRAAEEHDADLIIVGRASTNLLKRLVGHRVSENVLHRAHRTVLIAWVPKRQVEPGQADVTQIERHIEPPRERLAA